MEVGIENDRDFLRGRLASVRELSCDRDGARSGRVADAQEPRRAIARAATHDEDEAQVLVKVWALVKVDLRCGEGTVGSFRRQGADRIARQEAGSAARDGLVAEWSRG